MKMGLTKDDKDSKTGTGASPDAATEGSVPQSLWIFGYGSLIWKTNFPYQKRMVGHIGGYVRRFWQASVHHRGTPEVPGRVATLVKNDEGYTWGRAYLVDPHDVPEVMDYLNKRESGGYTTHELLFHPYNSSMESFTVLVYIATECNPNYVGPETVDDIVKKVLTCEGKSGPNVEYVLELAKAMKEIAPHVMDDHLLEIVDKIKKHTN